MAVSLAGPHLQLHYSLGVLYLLAASALGVGLSLLIKRLVVAAPAIPLAATNCLLLAVLFFVAAALWGDVAAPLHAPAAVTFWLLFSGAFGMFIGVGVYFVVVQRAGLLPTKFAELAMPVFTALWAAPILHEIPTTGQLLASLAIIGGCLMLLSARQQ